MSRDARIDGLLAGADEERRSARGCSACVSPNVISKSAAREPDQESPEAAGIDRRDNSASACSRAWTITVYAQAPRDARPILGQERWVAWSTNVPALSKMSTQASACAPWGRATLLPAMALLDDRLADVRDAMAVDTCSTGDAAGRCCSRRG